MQTYTFIYKKTKNYMVFGGFFVIISEFYIIGCAGGAYCFRINFNFSLYS